MVTVIRVTKRNAEAARSEAVSKGILNKDFRLKKDGDDVLIPVSGEMDGFTVEDADLERSEQRETDYRNLVTVSDDLRELLPSSFDVIGDVAVIKIPEDLMEIKESIGDAIITVTPSVRLVMMDNGVKGDLRIRELERIAGSGPTETVHKEFGVKMFVDPSKIYFNPRLATERMRVASQVQKDEIIIDMFAGVAPFPIVISKHSDASKIHAIDLNPVAYEFMVRNIELNKVNNVIPRSGDARKTLKGLPKADRIIMNLPQSASEFLSEALNASKVGAVIHLHMIMERDADDGITEKARSLGFNVKIRERTELKTYSPTMSVYVLDIVNEGPISSRDSK